MAGGSAFNNINALSLVIGTSLGTISSADESMSWSANDVAVEAMPGNDGNLYNAVFGAGGDALLNGVPMFNNWTITLHFLFKSRTYARLSYLKQKEIEALKGNIAPIGWYNFALEDANDPTIDGEHFYESIQSSQAKMLNVNGNNWGYNIDGDSTFSFLLCNANYLAPGYSESIIPVSAAAFPLRNEA